jgi:hypothetical protein
MTVSRYELRRLIQNNSTLYAEHFAKRDVRFINQFTTPEFPSDVLEKTKDLIYSYHVWKLGDRLYKLANEHYGDSSLWWVIALINQKPTESHFQLGDLVLIPKPLNKVLEMFKI